MKIATIAAAILAISPSVFAADAPPTDAKTVAILGEFSNSLVEALKDVHGDDQFKTIAAELTKLSQKLSDDQLRDVEKYALSKEGEPLRWCLGSLLVDRGQFDSAAHLFVVALADAKENRSYRMWKYWESYFGERKDYWELSRKLSIALMRQFEAGGPEYKQVVAELFGKGDAEAKMSVEDFKKAIDFDNKIDK